jgi:hypothetical protein
VVDLVVVCGNGVSIHSRLDRLLDSRRTSHRRSRTRTAFLAVSLLRLSRP